MPDVTAIDNKEAPGKTPKELYISRVGRPIESENEIVRQPDGSFKEIHYNLVSVIPTGPINWVEAYDINQKGTHTTGRRNGLKEFLDNGIEPFGTPVNQTLAEVPAVVCGYLKSNHALQSSETFQRNYGDIFNPNSEGFVVVLGSEVEQTDGYEVVGPEARLKIKVTPEMTRAIIVGNDKTEIMVVDELKKRGIILPVIRLNRVENAL